MTRFCLVLAILLLCSKLPVCAQTTSIDEKDEVRSALLTDSASKLRNTKQNMVYVKETFRQRVMNCSDTLDQRLLSIKSSLQNRIDSLKAKGQPTEKLQTRLNKLDSISKSPAQAQQKLTMLQAELQDSIYNSIPGARQMMTAQSKVNGAFGRINEVTSEIGIGQLGSEYQGKLKNAVPGLPDINGPDIGKLPGADANPNFNVDGKIPNTNNLGKGVNVNLPNASKVNELLPDEIQDATKAVSDVSGKLEEGQEVLGEGQQYLKDAKSIQEEGLRSEKINDLAENQVMKIDEISALEKERAASLGQIDEYKKLIEQYQNEKAIKAELEEKSKELANDIVAANQSKVDGSLKKLRKYNRKFDNIPDIRELPKRPPNELKKASFRKRVVPGLAFYTFATDRVWLQFDPQVLYRFNTNFSLGAGAMYRFSMTPQNLYFDNYNNLAGYKVFGQHFVYKGVWIKAEVQRVSWKPLHLLHNDPNHLDHVNVGAIGLMKRMTIAKRVKANGQTMYHYSWGGSDPYKTKIIFRLGIDISLEKKEPVVWKQQWRKMKRQSRKS